MKHKYIDRAEKQK